MKRTIDLSVSLILLPLLSPILLLIAIAIKINMGGPVLFKQERPGLYGKSFFLYKFRTMTNTYNKKGSLVADELRLTPLGKFLRKHSLDELPQLFNVVKGDMSLIGPRPLLVEYLSLYTEEQKIRHQKRPGITGWAQINGRNAITWEEKFALDVWYVENQTLRLDLKILFATIRKVLQSDGITQADHATSEKFTGSNEVV